MDASKHLKLGFYLNVFSLSFMLLSSAYLFILGTAIWSYYLIRWMVVFPTFVFIFVFLFVLIYYDLLFYNRPVGQFISILLNLSLGLICFIYYLTPEKTWCIDFPAFNQFIGISGLILGILAICSTLFFLVKKDQKIIALSRKKHIILIGSLCLTAFLGISFSTNWFYPYYTLTVPAKNQMDPMQFNFWTHLNTSYYSADQWNELNQHHAILTAYEWDCTRNDTFHFAQVLRDNYTNIRIMFPIWGSYYWVDSFESQLDSYLKGIQTYNLTNVIGFSFDLERENDTCVHNKSKLELAKTTLAKCINTIRTTYPTYRIDNSDGIWMMFDRLPLGGSFELYKQHVLMSITEWDHYAWQIYRGNAVDPESDPQSSDLYERMRSSVEYLGANATTPIFGMNAVGDYGPNNCSKNGIKCNFAGLIKDCKIARGLGIQEVQFYTLADAGVYNGVYYPSMFEGYGQDFLDVLNQSVNGLTEPETFIIPGNVAWKGTVGYWWEDVVYSISWVVVLCIVLLSCLNLIIVHLFVPSLKEANKEQKATKETR